MAPNEGIASQDSLRYRITIPLKTNWTNYLVCVPDSAVSRRENSWVLISKGSDSEVSILRFVLRRPGHKVDPNSSKLPVETHVA
jgi:hypothetical protein